MFQLNKLMGPHSLNLERALDRTAERHSLLTTNLANVNVPGYKRRDIDFGIELEGAQGRRAGSLRRTGDPQSKSGSNRIDGNSVDMEKEVVAIGESEVRYETLIELTSRYFSGLKTVIREGR
ncbi:MAG: hypothetical protein KIT11_02765 [Fimbriimonadaceae bacterium]|nr:hypothetical protein [Fimbriimonadaceae bacterium]QYK54709.1 MAG: hypothetical protein KF733_06760 [Fimbriimonadaceae bacterium]